MLRDQATAPKLITESISQASAAVARACTILSKEKMLVGGVVAVVEGERCAACLTCVRVCPYDVPVMNAQGRGGDRRVEVQGVRQLCGGVSGAGDRPDAFQGSQLEAKCRALVMDHTQAHGTGIERRSTS